MKILVRNLARTTTQADILVLFEAHGTVESCTLVMDAKTGRSKGFGFVEMPDDTEANSAIEALNGQKIDKSKIRIKSTQVAPD
jgi:RNA recognition motif-containing protein